MVDTLCLASPSTVFNEPYMDWPLLGTCDRYFHYDQVMFSAKNDAQFEML